MAKNLRRHARTASRRYHSAGCRPCVPSPGGIARSGTNAMGSQISRSPADRVPPTDSGGDLHMHWQRTLQPSACFAQDPIAEIRGSKCRAQLPEKPSDPRPVADLMCGGDCGWAACGVPGVFARKVSSVMPGCFLSSNSSALQDRRSGRALVRDGDPCRQNAAWARSNVRLFAEGKAWIDAELLAASQTAGRHALAFLRTGT